MFDGYIICGTPRTGSTLLCDLLTATGAAGAPDSFYRAQSIDWWAGEWGLADRDTMPETEFQRAYLGAAIRAGKAGTPVFGMRLMQENLSQLCRVLDGLFPGQSSDKARLEKAFGKLLFIHLSRRDKLAQAVSLVKAKQTGLWHIAPDGTEVERLSAPSEPVYDFALIRSELEKLDQFDRRWRLWFGKQGLEPLAVTYENMSADPTLVLDNICAILGVNIATKGEIRPGVGKLADAVSQQWMERYRLDADANKNL